MRVYGAELICSMVALRFQIFKLAFCHYNKLGLPRCKDLWNFFFVLSARGGVRLLFDVFLLFCFPLCNVICEFHRFLHRGWANKLHLHAEILSYNLGQNLLRRKNIFGTPTSYPNVPLETFPFPSPPPPPHPLNLNVDFSCEEMVYDDTQQHSFIDWRGGGSGKGRVSRDF